MAFGAAQEQSKSTKPLNISIIKKGGFASRPGRGRRPNGLYLISFHYQGAIYTLLTRDSVFSCAEIVSRCRWDVDSGAASRANMTSHIREDGAEARDERWYPAMAVDFPGNFPPSQTVRIIEPKGDVFLKPIMSRTISKWRISYYHTLWCFDMRRSYAATQVYQHQELGLVTDSYIWIK